MIEHRLYGVQVNSHFSLFEHCRDLAQLAPGNDEPIWLQQANPEEPMGPFVESSPLYSTQGRELLIRTDRSLKASVAGQPWMVDVLGVVSFTWYGGDNRIFYHCENQVELALVAFWFVHVFLPLYLTLERSYDFIHSAAVEVDGSPLLFAAPSTGGKSTLADYFLQQGHALLSDDKVATFFHKGRYWALPSHPHHRPWREVEVIGTPVDNFFSKPAPLQSFYLLEADDAESDVEIVEVHGFRKFESLLPNFLFDFGYLRDQRMRSLAQLADQSRVFRLRRPWDIGRMGEVYESVCAQVRSTLAETG